MTLDRLQIPTDNSRVREPKRLGQHHSNYDQSPKHCQTGRDQDVVAQSHISIINAPSAARLCRLTTEKQYALTTLQVRGMPVSCVVRGALRPRIRLPFAEPVAEAVGRDHVEDLP